MHIRPATPSDLITIMPIIDDARLIMRENGNLTQWINGYPSTEVILNDIDNGHGFVCISEDEIVGYFCFIAGDDPEPTYNVIEGGAWLNSDPYGVIHRLASGRKARGIARAAFEFAFTKTATIRVDTHHDNIPMQNFLKKNGFEYCGIIYVNDGTPRDAFQKTIA
ncbi:GNAT family N-acetyltransferase [Flavobacterium sp.]|uniref:GNAT family N-acetyltransferase n=1 Tax=Flavobacterium sp. TaxID=239 RepID=UPI004034D4D0